MMKHPHGRILAPIASLALALICTLAPATLSAANYMDYYNEARAAMKAKDYALAEQKVLAALELKPNHPPSISLLHQLRASAPKADLIRSSYDRVTLANVVFEDATVQSCLEYLRVEAGKTAGRNFNFVYNLPADMATKRITLRLQKIPLESALKYVTDLAGCDYRLERNAVVFNPPGGSRVTETEPTRIRPASPVLQSLILNKVSLTDMSVEDAFNDLRNLAAKDSQGAVEPNFVISIPKEQLADRKVNLELEKIAFFDAVRLLTEHVGADFKVGTYAITISAPAPAAPAPAAEEQPADSGANLNNQPGNGTTANNEGGFLLGN